MNSAPAMWRRLNESPWMLSHINDEGLAAKIDVLATRHMTKDRRRAVFNNTWTPVVLAMYDNIWMRIKERLDGDWRERDE